MRHDQSLCAHERVIGVFIFGDSQSESRHLLTPSPRFAAGGRGRARSKPGSGDGAEEGVPEFFPKGTTPSNGCRGENRWGGPRVSFAGFARFHPQGNSTMILAAVRISFRNGSAAQPKA